MKPKTLDNLVRGEAGSDFNNSLPESKMITSYEDVREDVRSRYSSFFGVDIPSEIEEKIHFVDSLEKDTIGLFKKLPLEIIVKKDYRRDIVATIMHELGHYKFYKDSKLSKILDVNRLQGIKTFLPFYDIYCLIQMNSAYSQLNILSETAAYFCEFVTRSEDALSGSPLSNSPPEDNPMGKTHSAAYYFAYRWYCSGIGHKVIWDVIIKSKSVKSLNKKLRNLEK